jgi:peptidoglycan/xylan/chitin deacetylase (PgdA/CDA1 family)
MSFRLDRFATLYFVRPVQSLLSGDMPSIPILMYHSITDEDEEDETKVHAYYRTATSPSVFARHMHYLHEHGYSTVNVPDAVRLLQNGESTKKYVVVTFDDGYADFYAHAFPALNRHGFSATVFLPTGYIGKVSVPFKGKDCLTWGEVRELRKYGISFGSHTVTHPQLSTLDVDMVKAEIVNSKRAIEDNLGESVDSFAYPFAFPEQNTSFVGMLRNVLVESGYHQGVSTRIGTARKQEDRYFLRRLPMNSLDDPALFSAKLQGGYNWLHTIQYGSKLLTSWSH